MSLYDDVDAERGRAAAEGWSSGIRLLQSQLQIKRVAPAPPRPRPRPPAALPPVINLKSRREDEPRTASVIGITSATTIASGPSITVGGPVINTVSSNIIGAGGDWCVAGEYDPAWPNDYDKMVKELREQRDRENDMRYDEKDRKSHRKRKSRFGDNDDTPERMMLPRTTEDELERTSPVRSGGAEIAPPPSLQEPEATSPPPPPVVETFIKQEKPTVVPGYGANSVAAKIMAKYGFKEGQGLGKKEQGMSMALQVQKTSKRGGRIIHEKDSPAIPPPPTFGEMPPPDFLGAEVKMEPSITEIMKSPSKVVLLRNMVGPGDVDEELEPEVKDECNSKYGDVIRVVIHEIQNVPSDEAVRIFVEFKRIESAIKAVVDLNARFFGGRQVKAGFYSVERFENQHLLD